MAKILTILNCHNPHSEEAQLSALDYNFTWQRKAYRDSDIFIAALELPEKREHDFWLETQTHVLALDGEIYSYASQPAGEELTKWLLALYLEKGSECVRNLNGNFSLVIWDKQKKQLFVCCDRFALRPIYYSQYHGKSCFASEIKAILADGDFDRQLDMEGVVDFFTYEYMLQNRTFLKNARVFPAASTLCMQAGEEISGFEKYWDCSFEKEASGLDRIDDYAEQLKEKMEQSVARRLRGPWSVGVPLSGGLDSRTIVSSVPRDYRPLHTFTFGERGCNDQRYAQRVSKLLGTTHHYVGIQREKISDFLQQGVYYCDGMVSCLHYHIFNILDGMTPLVQVALDGFMGCVLPRNEWIPRDHKSAEEIFVLNDVFGADLRSRILSVDLQKEIETSRERFVDLWTTIHNGCPRPTVYFNLTQRQPRFTNYGTVHMRNFLEIRIPFADYDYMDFCLKIPDDLLRDARLLKRMFCKCYPDVARVPRTGSPVPMTASRIGHTLYWQKYKLLRKLGKLPPNTHNYACWFRTFLKDFVCDTLHSDAFRSRGLFDSAAVEKLLQDHFSGAGDYSRQIAMLLTFELWQRFFFDGDVSRPALD